MKIFSSTAFKEKLLQIWSMGELLDLKPTRNQNFYCSSLTKKGICIFALYAERASNPLMLAKLTYIQNSIWAGIRGPDRYLEWKQPQVKNLMQVYLQNRFWWVS